MTANGSVDGRLRGKVALVTGAASGIGEAAARQLAAQGASVVLADLRGAEAERVGEEITAAGGTALAVTADVTKDEEVAALVRATEDAFGGLDVAFNNAGEFGPMGRVEEIGPEEWTADLTELLTSVFLPLRHEIPAMRRRGGGSVVNTASTMGVVGIDGGISSYTAGKHGVIGLTKAAALEYADANIRVNALALGTVDTPRYRDFVGDSQEMLRTLEDLHPLGRIGTAEEAASAVVYLAGDEAAFFTGSVLVMDGGWTAR